MHMGSSCSSGAVAPLPRPPTFVCQQVAALRSFLEAALDPDVVHDDASLCKHTSEIHPDIMAAMDSARDAEAFMKGLLAGWRSMYAPFPKDAHDDMMVVLNCVVELEKKSKENAQGLCDLLDKIVGDS